MNRDDLRLTFASVGLMFPTAPPFDTKKLADLYAALCSRHTFKAIEMHGEDGATISTEGLWEIELDRNTIMIEETVTSRGFDIIRQDFADFVGIVRDQLSIRQFFEPRIEMRALWPVPVGSEMDAAAAMRANALGIGDDQFELLLEGAELGAVGLTLRAGYGSEENPGHLSVEVMPYEPDPTQVHIVMSIWRHSMIETPEVVEQRLEEAHDYFRKRVASFVATFMP